MKVHYSLRALADLAAIADYIHERNPSAAVEIELCIRSAVDLLIAFPRMGRDRPKLKVRALKVARYPYMVYYRVERGALDSAYSR